MEGLIENENRCVDVVPRNVRWRVFVASILGKASDKGIVSSEHG